MTETKIIEITEQNINSYPSRCFLKNDNPGQIKKNDWTLKRMLEGMKIKLLYLDNKLCGYIEYIPGELAWRAIDANNYFFIHCIWMTPNKNKQKGYASQLIQECMKDAEKNDSCGVAVITSDGPFMASREVFEKNGFHAIQEDKPYQLLMKQFKDCKTPSFHNYKEELKKYKGLHIVYSHQCPWVNRFMDEMKDRINELDISITKIDNAKDAQHSPSLYATFNLIYDGNLLVDHYISAHRFENIIKKELNLKK